MARWGSCGRRTNRPGALSAYSESGQIPAYAVTSALVPISSNSGVSHFWSSMAITSFRMDSIVQAYRILTGPDRSHPSSPVNQATMAQGPLRTEPETFLLVRWAAYAAQRTRHQCLSGLGDLTC